MSEEMMRPPMELPHSSFYPLAQEKLQKLEGKNFTTESKSKAAECMQLIDQQYVRNLTTFKAKSGATYPITSVSVTEIVRAMLDKYPPQTQAAPASDAPTPSSEIPTSSSETTASTSESSLTRKKVDIIFPGYYYSPNLNPLGHGDMVYDRVTLLMGEVMRSVKSGDPIDSRIYIWGYPNGVWGDANPDWIQSLKTMGLSRYSDDIAEFVKTLDTRSGEFRFHGMSAGSAIAALTAEKLKRELPTGSKMGEHPRLQVLLDNPAGLHIGLEKGAQVGLGFILEAIVRGIADPASRQASFAISSSLKDSVPYFDQRASNRVDPNTSPEQMKLKWEATIAGLMGLIRGTPLDTQEMHVFIRRGIIDPVSFSPPTFLHELGQIVIHAYNVKFREEKTKATPLFREGRRVEFPLRTSHAIGYFKPEHFVNMFIDKSDVIDSNNDNN
jgi:hypothetical protein